MESFVGLDVSQRKTSVCVIDGSGESQWEGICRTTPVAIGTVLRSRAPNLVRVGLETGPLSTWLWHALRDSGFPVVCLHAREAAAALKLQAIKSDANDANGLAQIVRTGWYRPVAVKSMSSHQIRTTLAARAKLVSIRTTLYNQIRGLFKTYGVILAPGKGGTFEARLRGALPGDESTRATFNALVDVWRKVSTRKTNLDRLLEGQAKQDSVCQRLMTVPGVGAITAIAFRATIDDPKRFRRSSDVGAYLGLTPRKYQSGDVDRSGSITKSGDRMLRSYLFEAANVIMHRCTTAAQDAPLRRWALDVSRRAGNRKAKVALARKLAVLLHRLWVDETHFIVEHSIPAALSRVR